MTPRAGILRALLIAGLAFMGLAWITWFADGLSERIAPSSVDSPPPATAANLSRDRAESTRQLAEGDPLPFEPPPAPVVEEEVEVATEPLSVLDLEVWGGIPLNVVDLGGRPIEGATASTRNGYESWPPTETDEDGFMIFEIDESRPDQLGVRAVGFITAHVDVPLRLEGPLLVALEPKNLIRVQVVTKNPSDVEHLTVMVTGTEEIFVADRRGGMALPTERSGLMSSYKPDAEGLVEIRGIRPTAEVDLHVSDCFSHVLHSERLPDRTTVSYQELVVVVPGASRTWSGRVEYETGAPVAGAEVRVVGEGVSIGTTRVRAGGCVPARTGVDGDFQLPGVWVDKGRVTVSPPFASEVLRHEVVRPGSASRGGQAWSDVDFSLPRTFVLDGGRAFTVHVRDAAGIGLYTRSLSVLDEQHGAIVDYIREGRFEVTNAPHSDCVVRATVAGEAYEEVVPAEDDEVVITTPVHGGFEVVVDNVPRQPPFTSLADLPPSRSVILRPRSESLPERSLSMSSREGGTVATALNMVLPGVYEAFVQSRAMDRESGDLIETELTERVTVTIVAGQTTKLRIVLDE